MVRAVGQSIPSQIEKVCNCLYNMLRDVSLNFREVLYVKIVLLEIIMQINVVDLRYCDVVRLIR